MVEYQETAGNGSVVILIHDRSQEAELLLEEAVLSCLDQFGIPFRIECIDESWCDSNRAREILGCAALMLPQSGTMDLLTGSYAVQLINAITDGLGFIVYEQDKDSIPLWFQGLMNLEAVCSSKCFTDLITEDHEGFITWKRNLEETVSSDIPVPYCRCRQGVTQKHPLVNEYGDAMMYCRDRGEGHIVFFPFAVCFYTIPYLGHACGADDIFCRSIISAARKPFLTWSMRESAGLVVDDCSGSYDHFGYVDIMNEYGWKPYLALFTDTIDEVAHDDIHKTAKIMKSHYEEGTAEIGFHALRYNESFCFNHLERRALTKAELDDRFDRWDHYIQSWGIQHSPWAHPHFGEIGRDALPYYRDRGIRFLTYLLPFDAAWFDVPDRISPLPPMEPYGHNGYYFTRLDACPEIYGCNCVLDRKSRTTTDYVVQTDYLWSHTPFWGESENVEIGKSAETLALQIRRGIDSGFYGEGATHEQRIAVMRAGELHELFQETERLLLRYEFTSATLSTLLEEKRKHHESAFEQVDILNNGKDISCRFSCEEAVGTYVQRYENDGEKNIRKYEHLLQSREMEIPSLR